MTAVDCDTVFRTFDSAVRSEGVDYSILPFLPDAWAGCSYLAISRQGWPALIVPVRSVTADNVRLTHGLAFRALVAVELSDGRERWTRPAAVLECREPQLTRTFAAMVAAFAARIAQHRPASLEFVSGLLTEWEDLLSRRGLLSAERELGLWAELWLLARTKRIDELLEAWRGPDSEWVDFLLDGKGFEVKASHRERVHVVSQEQVEPTLGNAEVFLLSLHVAVDPVHGKCLSNVVAQVAAAASDVAKFEEKLASVGYCRDDEQAYRRRYVVLSPPAVYRAQDVPRVRLADPGISQIRYRVELPAESLTAAEVGVLGEVLGIDLMSLEYPCA
jgi:Putative  PD-(D/E)XK family member, (DUF4420)